MVALAIWHANTRILVLFLRGARTLSAPRGVRGHCGWASRRSHSVTLLHAHRYDIVAWCYAAHFRTPARLLRRWTIRQHGRDPVPRRIRNLRCDGAHVARTGNVAG